MRCDMERDCMEPVTFLDKKGYAYCQNHGNQMKAVGRSCRKLKPAEILKMEQEDSKWSKPVD